MLKFLFTIVFLVTVISAVYNGVPDETHQFAGYIGVYYNRSCPDGRYLKVLASCGASLIDAASLFGQDYPELYRRIAITSGHCTITREFGFPGVGTALPREPIQLSFARDPGYIFDFNCGASRRRVGVSNKAYIAKYAWTRYVAPNDPRAGDPMPGQMEDDYAIVLLDTPVSAADVPKPAVVVNGSPSYLRPGSSLIPRVGMAGYGIVSFGQPTRPFGSPDPVLGNLTREYIEMNTNSISNVNLMTSMVAAKEEDTACAGDSGSAAFPIAPDTNGVYTLLALTSSGDANCRATNNAARVGTSKFYEYIDTILPEILAVA